MKDSTAIQLGHGTSAPAPEEPAASRRLPSRVSRDLLRHRPERLRVAVTSSGSTALVRRPVSARCLNTARSYDERTAPVRSDRVAIE
jgi:hypothetical protein